MWWVFLCLFESWPAATSASQCAYDLRTKRSLKYWLGHPGYTSALFHLESHRVLQAPHRPADLKYISQTVVEDGRVFCLCATPSGSYTLRILNTSADKLQLVFASASFIAELSVRSPQKLFSFVSKNNILWIEVSKKHLIYFWKQKHCYLPTRWLG